MKNKTLFGALALLAGTALATVTVDNVADLENALLNTSETDIVLKPGVYDLSTLTPKTCAEAGIAPTSTDGRKAHLLVGRTILLRGEDPTDWRLKTREQESVLKGNGTARLFYAYAGGGRGSKFRNLTFEDGSAEKNTTTDDYQHGGAVYFMGNSTGFATNCVFRNCTAKRGGGTHCVTSYDCLYENCTATENGGGAYGAGNNSYASPTNRYVKCVFQDCTAQNGGGLYHAESREQTGARAGYVADCTFSNNVATVAGGGLYGQEAGLVRGCRFEANRAPTGGALGARDQMQSLVTNCTFVGNAASTFGGAVVNYARVEDSVFEGNVAQDNGGAGMGGSFQRCLFRGNATAQQGGALFSGTAMDCRFESNMSTNRGGACAYVTATRCAFVGNCSVAQRAGAAYYGTCTDCVFTNNYCAPSARGGAAAFSRCTGCVFSGKGDVSVGAYTRCDFDGVVSDGAKFWVVDSVWHMGGSTYVTNCLFRNCRVKHLLANNGRDLEAVNCTFADNILDDDGCAVATDRGVEYSSPYKYHASSTYVRNCLFAGNRTASGVKGDLSVWARDEPTEEGTPCTNDVAYCVYETPVAWMAGVEFPASVRQGKPHFMGAKNPQHPYAITGDSAARNRGLNMDWMAAATDFAGAARIFDGTVDVGCYETALAPTGTAILFR